LVTQGNGQASFFGIIGPVPISLRILGINVNKKQIMSCHEGYRGGTDDSIVSNVVDHHLLQVSFKVTLHSLNCGWESTKATARIVFPIVRANTTFAVLALPVVTGQIFKKLLPNFSSGWIKLNSG
jgi:hypothetical protein